MLLLLIKFYMGVLNLQKSNKINEYLDKVCEQIRWKKAHSMITEEIKNHILDQKDAFLSQGLDDETAINKAILEMGDPITVGTDLDSIYRPKPEWGIIILTGMMLIIGLISRIFITQNLDIPGSLSSMIKYTLIGIGSMGIAYLLDFSIIGKYPRLIYFGTIIMSLVSIFIFPIIKGQYIQVKFIILLLPTAFAGIIYSVRNKGYVGIIIAGIYCIIPGIICLNISSLSSLVLYLSTCLILITFAISKGWFNVNKLKALLLIYIPTIVLSSTTVLFMKDYQLNRLKVAFIPSIDPLGDGYMAYTTRKIIGNANLIGKNITGMDTGGLLHDVNTDFLLTYLIDNLGWIAFIGIMLVVVVFIIRSFKMGLKQKGVLGGLVSLSVIINFTMQVIIYVMSNLGFQLISPLTLPLISYGRLGTIINMILIGTMLSVYKSEDLYKNNKITKDFSENPIFQFKDGKIIIDFNKR